MKKWSKVFLIIIIFIISGLILDRVSLIFFNKALFVSKSEVPYKYSGIYYDVFYCPDFEKPKVFSKDVKLACSHEKGKIKSIENKADKIKNFECIPYIEEFYKDAEYTYHFKCKISEYIYVKYMNGYEELVIDAINKNTISIEDLDEYDIEYTKIPRK